MEPLTSNTHEPRDLQAGAQFLQAFLECSTELQGHAKKMLAVIFDPAADDDDREDAAITLADILFPNTHEGDKMLGMDLADVERLARQHPESGKTLIAMDAEEELFANRLQDAMKKAGVTQRDLAARIGVGQPAVSMMLARKCRPQRRTVEKLANALGVAPADLWTNIVD